MYKTFEDAKAAAISVITKKYNGEKNGCVITENKTSKRAHNCFFGFHFNDTDTNGSFVQMEDGTFQKKVLL